MRVGFALERHDRILGPVFGVADEPDLAGAALHLVGGRPLVFRQVRQRLAELDHIAVAILPVLEEGEIVHDFVKAGHRIRPLSLRLAYRRKQRRFEPARKKNAVRSKSTRRSNMLGV